MAVSVEGCVCERRKTRYRHDQQRVEPVPVFLARSVVRVVSAPFNLSGGSGRINSVHLSRYRPLVIASRNAANPARRWEVRNENRQMHRMQELAVQ